MFCLNVAAESHEVFQTNMESLLIRFGSNDTISGRVVFFTSGQQHCKIPCALATGPQTCFGAQTQIRDIVLLLVSH